MKGISVGALVLVHHTLILWGLHGASWLRLLHLCATGVVERCGLQLQLADTVRVQRASPHGMYVRASEWTRQMYIREQAF